MEYMARLARLELNPKEKEKFQKDLGQILKFVDKLKELKVEGVEPTAVQTETANVMRTDKPRFEHDPKTASKILEQAPNRKDNFLKVKSILKK